MTAYGGPAARPTVHIDDDVVRVTEWRFAPGATTGHHINMREAEKRKRSLRNLSGFAVGS